MEKNVPNGFAAAGLTLLKENMVNVKGIAECPVNIDYKTVIMRDVVDADYAIIIGRKVGVSFDKDLFASLDKEWPNKATLEALNTLYSTFIYAVMDEGFTRKWAFHSPKPFSVRGTPSYGTRYGTSWTGPRFFNYWLIELQLQGLISPGHLDKIATNLMLWNNGHGQEHLQEYYTDEFKKTLQERLTKLFTMMAWAHRDYLKWQEVQEFINSFPPVEPDPFPGPAVQEIWNGEKFVTMHLLQANLK